MFFCSLCASYLTLISAIAISTATGTACVPLTIKEPSGIDRKAWPVTSGIPLPEGALSNPDCVRLLSDGKELPLQTETLSSWPDGSIKWLLLDFQVDLGAEDTRNLTLEYGPDIKRSPVDNPAEIQNEQDTTQIVAGPLKINLSHSEFRLLDSVWLDLNGDGIFAGDERLTSAGGSGIVLTDPEGRLFRADNSSAEVKVEQAGPMR